MEVAITNKMRVCICLGSVIVRDYFYCEKKQIPRRMQKSLTFFFVNMGIATNFKAMIIAPFDVRGDC